MTSARPQAERVLVVDRDPGLRNQLAAHLGALGHSVIGVDTGTAALDLLRRARPTAVIAEIGATGRGGESLVAALRHDRAGAAIPVLVMGETGHGSAFDDLLPLGKVWYIARGADPAHLERTFSTMVFRNEVAEPAL